MSVQSVYVMCVFNIYADEPRFAEETDEDVAKRKRRFHYAGFTADEAKMIALATIRESKGTHTLFATHDAVASLHDVHCTQLVSFLESGESLV